jgi:WD40-like Beta Propeller Repeat
VGYAACALAAIAGTGIFLGLRGGGGSTGRSPQDQPSAPINARSAPPHGGSSGLVAVARVYRGRATPDDELLPMRALLTRAESHILLVDPSRRSRPRDLGAGWGPSWSPDGRKLVFTYGVDHGGRGFGGGLERLFVMNADGSGRHPLPMPSLGSPRFEDWAPAWAPDGRRIRTTAARPGHPTESGSRSPSAQAIVGDQNRSSDLPLSTETAATATRSCAVAATELARVGHDLGFRTEVPQGSAPDRQTSQSV